MLLDPITPPQVDQTQPSLMIGIPCYGGQLYSSCVGSLFGLMAACGQHGISVHLNLLPGHSIISHARNMISSHFLFDTKCSHLLFLDADIAFDPEDVLRLLKADRDIIALPCATKKLDWQRISDAAKTGVAAADLPQAGLFEPNFKLLSNAPHHHGAIVEVVSVGMGCALVKREVFQKLADAHPERKFLFSTKESSSGRRNFACEFFRHYIKDGRFLGEDVTFCLDWRDQGGRVHILPTAKTGHFGTFCFPCDLSAAPSSAPTQATQ
jgi:hypothetical protein